MTYKHSAVSRRAALAQFFAGGAFGSTLLSSKGAAAATAYEYDALGRVAGVTYSDGSTHTYAYDAAGNRTQAVKTGVGPSNLWPEDSSQWLLDGSTVAADGTLAGLSAYRITTTPGGWGMVYLTTAQIAVGKVATLTTYFQPVSAGNTTTDFAISGSVEGWIPSGGSSGAKISGPGTLAQIAGGLWQVYNMSTTQPTKVQITWTNSVAQSLSPRLWATQSHVSGDEGTFSGASFTIT